MAAMKILKLTLLATVALLINSSALHAEENKPALTYYFFDG